MTSTATLLHICMRNCSFESAGGVETANIILCSFPPSFTCYDTAAQTCVYATVFISFIWPSLLQQHQLQSAGFCTLSVFPMLQPGVCKSTPCLLFPNLQEVTATASVKRILDLLLPNNCININMCMLKVHFQTHYSGLFVICHICNRGFFTIVYDMEVLE